MQQNHLIVNIYKTRSGDYSAKLNMALKKRDVDSLSERHHHLTVGLFNARSICNKVTSVWDLITEHEIDILCVTETWLHMNDRAKAGKIHEIGFNIYSKPRAGRGGGSAFIFKPCL